MNPNNQQKWFERAKKVLPAGGFGNFDGSFIARNGEGAHIWDEDGKRYIDYLIGSGPMLLGHSHPEVIEAVIEQLSKGMTFFASNTAGIELAEVICKAVPCAEQLRYVCTGGEADMYAIRLARAYTGKNKILKFEGGYHGMSAEALMSLAPKQLVNFPHAIPDSAGIPKSVAEQMVIAPFNDIEAVSALLDEYADDIAGIIVEPLQRLIPPEPGFLQGLRDLSTRYGIVLIFDEVVTGFRLSYGGAQQFYGVTPDLCTLGKLIGGGMPLAAIAGTADIMKHFDLALVGSDGFTFQMGTLSGNPVAAVAGLKTLEILRRDGAYEQLRHNGETVMSSTRRHLDAAGITHQVVGDATLFDVLFTNTKVLNYRHVHAADASKQSRYNTVLRKHGIFKSVGKTYPSIALSDDDLAATDNAIEHAARSLN